MEITSRSLLLRVILFCFLFLDERVVKHIYYSRWKFIGNMSSQSLTSNLFSYH